MGWKSVCATHYDQISESLSALLPDWAGYYAYNVLQPQRVRIYDPVLALTEKIMYMIVILYLMVEFTVTKNYLRQEVPDGKFTFDFERMDFNIERNLEWMNHLPYCHTRLNEYNFLHSLTNKSTGVHMSPVWVPQYQKYVVAEGKLGNSYLNDDKIACKQFNFAEIVHKGADRAYVMTYQKETLGTIRRCGEVDGSTTANGTKIECDSVRHNVQLIYEQPPKTYMW